MVLNWKLISGFQTQLIFCRWYICRFAVRGKRSHFWYLFSQCSILQPKVAFLPLSFSLFTLKHCGLLFEQEKKVSPCSPFAGSCLNFCVAFRKSCKDFYKMKSDGLYKQMPWNHDFVTSNLFLYLTNVFMQYHWNKYYCKIKGFILSSKEPSSSHAYHMWWLKVLSVYVCIYHLIFCW